MNRKSRDCLFYPQNYDGSTQYIDLGPFLGPDVEAWRPPNGSMEKSAVLGEGYVWPDKPLKVTIDIEDVGGVDYEALTPE